MFCKQFVKALKRVSFQRRVRPLCAYGRGACFALRPGQLAQLTVLLGKLPAQRHNISGRALNDLGTRPFPGRRHRLFRGFCGALNALHTLREHLKLLLSAQGLVAAHPLPTGKVLREALHALAFCLTLHLQLFALACTAVGFALLCKLRCQRGRALGFGGFAQRTNLFSKRRAPCILRSNCRRVEQASIGTGRCLLVERSEQLLTRRQQFWNYPKHDGFVAFLTGVFVLFLQPFDALLQRSSVDCRFYRNAAARIFQGFARLCCTLRKRNGFFGRRCGRKVAKALLKQALKSRKFALQPGSLFFSGFFFDYGARLGRGRRQVQRLLSRLLQRRVTACAKKLLSCTLQRCFNFLELPVDQLVVVFVFLRQRRFFGFFLALRFERVLLRQQLLVLVVQRQDVVRRFALLLLNPRCGPTLLGGSGFFLLTSLGPGA